MTTSRTSPVARVPAPLVVAGALVGGYAVGRSTGDRRLAGVALLTGLAVVVPRWARTSVPLAVGASAGTAALVGVSHPLAHRTGPWPAVLVSAGAAAVLAAVADRVARDRRA